MRGARRLLERIRGGIEPVQPDVPAALDMPVHPEVMAIGRLGIFDSAGYLQRNPDVAESGIDPLEHFVADGAREGRAPCDFFDPAYYLDSHPDVAAAGVNPLLHFFETGWREGRHPSRDFDLDWYAATHLGGSGEVNPLLHYLESGRAQGLEIRPVVDPDVELVRQSGVFDEAYYLETYPDIESSRMDPLDHFLRFGATEARNPSAMFDTAYYLANNPDVAGKGINPLVHFCAQGWKELRNPSRQFDVWWYWSRHLDPAVEDTNPLGHYQSVGRHAGLDTLPPAQSTLSPARAHRHPDGRAVRRLCLFAGHDRDGIVDACVVDYVRELSRHADVFYLADCEMAEAELGKLSPFVQGAWAWRHGKRGFGSWSELIRRLGWECIGQYDEMLLVDDSCYLLGPLDRVFECMDRRPGDWWGLQATKGIPPTEGSASNRFRWPIPLHELRGWLLDTFERDYHYDFHVGSYFLAYRKPVIDDPRVRRMFESITVQESRLLSTLKYEAGFTRHLIAFGHAFDTYVGSLYPFHPLHSSWYFRLLDEGFPLLKRSFLAENRHAVAGLHRWADRIRMNFPDADIGAIEGNLGRLVEPGKLFDNLHLGETRLVHDAPPADHLLTDDEFVDADRASPKHAHWWAFPVCAFTGVFSGNERAVFEEVKDDPGIRKIILTRGKPVSVDGTNVEVVELESPLGQHRLMRAGNIFIKHDASHNIVFPVSAGLHNIINLWHGIPFKKIGYVSEDIQDQLDRFEAEHVKYRAVIASSRIDRLAMAAAFYPIQFDSVWNTGLPRNDFILRDEARLPGDMRRSLDALREQIAGRRLVLFMPTFRNAQEEGSYRFDDDEKNAIYDWLEREDAILGLREHMADSDQAYAKQLAGPRVIDLGSERFPDAEILYRASSALITDYSSSFIDYMLTGKPAVSFAYDHASYVRMERGAFYDLRDVFPGPVCRNFDELLAALESLFAPRPESAATALDRSRRLFFDRIDDGNAARVVARVRELSDRHGLGMRGLFN
ncbi:MAG: CDP-glycerol glycerophosphotransferase family protein [Luteimonas sp.]|nr:CDP-glycerol glycerophosphotransferase family protein [Luteimonas sp.]